MLGGQVWHRYDDLVDETVRIDAPATTNPEGLVAVIYARASMRKPASQKKKEKKEERRKKKDAVKSPEAATKKATRMHAM